MRTTNTGVTTTTRTIPTSLKAMKANTASGIDVYDDARFQVCEDLRNFNWSKFLFWTEYNKLESIWFFNFLIWENGDLG